MTYELPLLATDDGPWAAALYGFLAEKQRRSGSRRTVESYTNLLRDFFRTAAKPPDRVASHEVFTWAYGRGVSGKDPSANTISARIACLSSFYRFLIRMGLLQRNPCDQLQRPHAPATTPRGLTADEVRRLLAVLPGTPEGLRDGAFVLTLVLTGRR